ncbi:MAG: hypothetical protein R3B47_11205 [Bacteroidia bacterium]
MQDVEQPILLVVDENRVEEAVTRLSRVGFDNTIGYLKGGMDAWKTAGKPVSIHRNPSPQRSWPIF